MFNFSSKEQRKVEEPLYSAVTEEIERNEIYKPLWIKALADSDNNQQKTQALYIKYRVQKLKDEISDQQDAQKEQKKREDQLQAKVKKDGRNLETLNTTVKNTVSIFRWLILAMVFISAVTLFLTYFYYESGDAYELWAIMGGVVMVLGLYLFYLTKRVNKVADYSEVKRRLSILFCVLIPFSLLGTILGVVSPVVGLVMFIAFIGLLIRAIKFYSAFNYAKRNGLI